MGYVCSTKYKGKKALTDDCKQILNGYDINFFLKQCKQQTHGTCCSS